MKKYKIEVILILTLMSLFSFGTAPVAPEPEQATPIKIGVFTPETAGLTLYGPWTKQGFELGLIYATGGTNQTSAGRPYEIHYYDTQGSTNAVVTALTNAIEKM